MRRLKTVRRPPIYPKTPGHLPCSSLTHPLPLSSRRPSVSFGGFGIRLNIDKGNQAQEGQAMIILGNVANPEVAGDEYKLKTMDNQGRPVEVMTDDQGQVWLIVGTDSGFEGLSAFYYPRITYVFTTERPDPLKTPYTGDLSLPGGVLAGAALLGIVLTGFGTAALLSPNPPKEGVGLAS